MKSYQQLLQHILDNGVDSTDRTGVGTRRVFGYQWRHNLRQGFPLLTTKKIHFKSVAEELIWFLSGSTNNNDLKARGVTIWNEWAKEDGSLGPIYGKQWRDFGGVDQIKKLVEDIKISPDSRRLIVSAWNPPDVPSMALPPCHTLWQVAVINGQLNLHLYARSIDAFLGLPFNIASYALLLRLIACATLKGAGELIISFGDLHIYHNHMEQVKEQLSRTPTTLPEVFVWGGDIIKDNLTVRPTAKFDDVFELKDYNPQPAIKAPVAV